MPIKTKTHDLAYDPVSQTYTGFYGYLMELLVQMFNAENPNPSSGNQLTLSAPVTCGD